MLFPRETQDKLITLAEDKRILLEGNILKVLEYDGNEEFAAYVEKCKSTDKEKRKKRLDVTKQVQSQNKELDHKARELEKQSKELLLKNAENETLMTELKQALQKAESAKLEAERAAELAENAKKTALNDLDFIQQKTQFELIGSIVKMALWVIMGVGVIVTGMYVLAIIHVSDETTLIGSTWSNLFGILLTNSFSIIGTIMGVKYASDNTKQKGD
jgi:phage protein D